MRVLVMGGTRFTGRATVDELVQRGHDVTVFNRGTVDVRWPYAVDELHGDRNRDADLGQLRANLFDAVVDFSAYTGEQTARLVDHLEPVQRFVHCSTGAIYRPQAALPWDEQTPDGPWPIWGTYAEQKLASELVLRERSPAISTVCLRLPYVFGPRNYADREEFVLNRVLDDGVILVPGDGRAVQQVAFIDQVAFAFAQALELPDTGWQAVNIASGPLISLNGFVELCGEVCGNTPNVRYVAQPSSEYDKTNYLFPFPNENYILDIHRAERAGLITPGPTMREMLERALHGLVSDPARRQWQRSEAETRFLGGGT